MGFYWDDWPWVWFSHLMGPSGMLRIDVSHRPLSGLVLLLGSILFGENPVGWQIYNLILRLGGCLSLWWMLRCIWPKSREQINWTVLLFLVYPGFSQQFVAVNTSRHLLPLGLFFLSIGLMVKAVQNQERYWTFTFTSILVSLISMFTTEYYYGLELIRPVILWMVNRDLKDEIRKRAVASAKSWLPFMIFLFAVYVWRYIISHSVNYQITIFDEMTMAESDQVIQSVLGAMKDVYSTGVGAWGSIFQFPDPGFYGSRARLYYWVVVSTALVISLLFTSLHKTGPSVRKWGIEVMIVGAAFLLIAPIPFWVAGLDIKLSFPFDRLTLPSMVGSSLFLVGFLETVLTSKPAKVSILAIVIGLSAGFHYQNSVEFRRDWQHQTKFLQQLTWRIPELESGTAIVSNELPTTYSTDNSLTAPINWTYFPEFSGGDLPAYLFYADLRFGGVDYQLDKPEMSRDDYRFYPFRGSPEKVLVIYNDPPACMRVLSPETDGLYPGLPEDLHSILSYSDVSLINFSRNTLPTLPSPFYDEGVNGDWCYYFEHADLALQRSEWEASASFADLALTAGYPDSPGKHVTEYEVFIEAYARAGRWDDAGKLSLETRRIDQSIVPFLCETWKRVVVQTVDSQEKFSIVEIVDAELGCKIK